ncbi:MAG TPA: dienelactone hydrolase family protein [Bdellovibrionales bacterium]|nr:dienelactone hydrolase family protein [Bdellovibrionales bacterium]
MFHEISLHDRRRLIIRESLTGSRWWIVFLSGSAAEWTDFNESERSVLTRRFDLPPNILVIGKPGVLPSGRVIDSVFEPSFRRDTRVRDYLEVMRAWIPPGDRILLMGFSEGAYLSPEIALRDDRVRALALISGGTRSWIDEEIFKMGSRQEGKVLKRIARVYARPESRALTWFGNSHATWMSYDNDRTKEALEKVKVPILAIHGDKDRMIDLDSVRADLRAVRRAGREVEMHMLKNVDHTLQDSWGEALRLTGRFFTRQMVPKA